MKLGQAVDYFSTIPLDGLAGVGVWDRKICYGSFMTYDRFISARSFGQKLRLFQTNSGGPIDENYHVVRTPDGVSYIVDSHNVDMGGAHLFEQYNNIYQLRRADEEAEIISLTPARSASGLKGIGASEVSSIVPCDVERLSSSGSVEMRHVTTTVSLVTMPGDTVVTTDHELRIGGDMFDIREVFKNLRTIVARVDIRG